MLRGKPAVLLEEDVENIDENSAVKQMKFVKRCKEQVNKRWTNEYIHALEERMKKQVQVTETLSAIGSIVSLKDDVKNKAQWRTEEYKSSLRAKMELSEDSSLNLVMEIRLNVQYKWYVIWKLEQLKLMMQLVVLTVTTMTTNKRKNVKTIMI